MESLQEISESRAEITSFTVLLAQNAPSHRNEGTTTMTSSHLLQSQKNDGTDTASVTAQTLINKTRIKAQIQEELLGGTRHRRRMLREGGKSPTSASTAPLSGHCFSDSKHFLSGAASLLHICNFSCCCNINSNDYG